MRTIAISLLVSLLALANAQAERILRDLGPDLHEATIPVEEIFRGGPPPQGIPALGFAGLEGVASATQEPEFIPQEEAASWLADNDPSSPSRSKARRGPTRCRC